MSSTFRFSVGVLALAFAAGAAPASALAQADQGQMQPSHSARSFFRTLSPEQRMMLMVEMHDATANMTDDQKHAYRQQQREKFADMSNADRAKFASDLQAKWDAMPAGQRTEVEQKIAAFRAARMQHRQGSDGQ